MGQMLSTPVTWKESDNGGDRYVSYGTVSMQGWRITMEDAHSAVLQLPLEAFSTEQAVVSERGERLRSEHAARVMARVENDEQVERGVKDEHDKLELDSEQPLSFFGVFDGHGGSKVAHFAAEFLPERLVGTEEFQELRKQSDFDCADVEKAFCAAFGALDDSLHGQVNILSRMVGCTATTVLYAPKQNKLWCANVGDSRTVLSRRGKEPGSIVASPLSVDHKPTLPAEQARIEQAGGTVEVGRVNGSLAMSRAVGDFSFKLSRDSGDSGPRADLVICKPDVTEAVISSEELGEAEFVVLACDGIWDVMNSDEVIKFVKEQLQFDKLGVPKRQSTTVNTPASDDGPDAASSSPAPGSVPDADVVARQSDLTHIAGLLCDRCLASDGEVVGEGTDNMSCTIVALLNGRTYAEWRDWVVSSMPQLEDDYVHQLKLIHGKVEDQQVDC